MYVLDRSIPVQNIHAIHIQTINIFIESQQTKRDARGSFNNKETSPLLLDQEQASRLCRITCFQRFSSCESC